MKRSTLYWLLGLGLGLLLSIWGILHILTPASAAARVTRGKAVQAVSGTINVLPESQSDIPSPDTGIFKESNLKLGLVVQAGDLLGRLSPGDLPFHEKLDNDGVADIDQRLAGMLPSDYIVEGLKKQLADADQLRLKAYFPTSDYDKLVSDLKQADAQSKADRADLELKRKNFLTDIANTEDQIKRLEIHAPYNGTITAVLAYPGDLLTKEKPVAKIVSKDFKITAEVNQDDVAAVGHSKTAEIRFFAFRNNLYAARVKLLLPSADPTTQRFTVLLELVKPNDNLIPGLTGEVSFLAGEHDNALLIPRRALFGSNVIVADNGRVEVRKVKVGYLSLTTAEILDGLKVDDLVLTENLDLFRDGESVRVTSISEEGKSATPPAQ
jgi:RND family efflux transporter MFP subunit